MFSFADFYEKELKANGLEESIERGETYIYGVVEVNSHWKIWKSSSKIKVRIGHVASKPTEENGHVSGLLHINCLLESNALNKLAQAVREEFLCQVFITPPQEKSRAA